MGCCDILKISDNELVFMTGETDYDKGALFLQDKYKIPLLCVTLGKEGSRAYYKGMKVTGKPFLQENTIETTGAGDTFTGCMLNTVLADAQTRVQPPTDKGRRLKIYYMTQVGVKPPHFVVFCNDRRLFHFSYQRYLENCIRSTFSLEGTPIILSIRERATRRSNDAGIVSKWNNALSAFTAPDRSIRILLRLLQWSGDRFQIHFAG